MIPRLYVAHSLREGCALSLGEREAHYLRHVLRRLPGERVYIFNPADGEFEALIEGFGKASVELIVNRRRRASAKSPDLHLCFAPLKKEALDFLIEKATELGIAAFQPVTTERAQIHRLNEKRIRANIIEAAEQTERLDLPELFGLKSLDAMIADWSPRRLLLVCAEAGPALPAADLLDALKRDANSPHSAAILCGPEGGFSPRELDCLRNLPFVRMIGLGPRILRAETAALSAIALFQARLGDGGERPAPPLWEGEKEG